MPDNYTIEYGAPSVGGKMISAVFVHDKSEHRAVTMPVYLNEGGQFGERKYFVGTIEKKWTAPPNPETQGWDVTWGYNPVQSIIRDGVIYTYNRDLDVLKGWIEKDLRDAGILALGGGDKYDPKTGVGVQRKPKKPRAKKKKVPICTNTFIDGSDCTRPVAKQFVDREAAFHLCSECAEELGIS